MTIHTPESHEELKKMDFSAVYNDLRADISGIKGPEALGEPRYVAGSFQIHLDYCLNLQGNFTDLDFPSATGAMAKLASVISSVDMMLATTATFRLLCTPPICSSAFSARTPWTARRAGGTATLFCREVDHRTRWKPSSNSWVVSRAQRPFTRSWVWVRSKRSSRGKDLIEVSNWTAVIMDDTGG